MNTSTPGTSSTPLASVVVMTFNRPDSLRRCLTSLADQAMPAREFEVVVVDVSMPSVAHVTDEFRLRLEIKHLPAPNHGVAANRNVGARAARGQVLAFLDDDCIASSTWLSTLVDAMRNDASTMAGARAVHPDPATAIAAAGQVISEVVDGFFNPDGESARFLPGLNFALNRERYLALGGCDASFGFLAAEDRDFVDRWRRAGGKLVLCADTEVRHEHRSSLRGFVRQYFNYGRGARRYHGLRRQRKHGRMWEDAQLHTSLFSRLINPIRRVPPRLRFQVILLIGVWQFSNLAGFIWQAWLDIFIRPAAGRP